MKPVKIGNKFFYTKKQAYKEIKSENEYCVAPNA
jgi:hypothetical protein